MLLFYYKTIKNRSKLSKLSNNITFNFIPLFLRSTLNFNLSHKIIYFYYIRLCYLLIHTYSQWELRLINNSTGGILSVFILNVIVNWNSVIKSKWLHSEMGCSLCLSSSLGSLDQRSQVTTESGVDGLFTEPSDFANMVKYTQSSQFHHPSRLIQWTQLHYS